jgi:hypothetical protein
MPIRLEALDPSQVEGHGFPCAVKVDASTISRVWRRPRAHTIQGSGRVEMERPYEDRVHAP